MTTDQQRQEATRRVWQSASDKIRTLTNGGPINEHTAATVGRINDAAMGVISDMLWDDDAASVKSKIDAFTALEFTNEPDEETPPPENTGPTFPPDSSETTQESPQ